ncbi:hypothetical protein [Mucilaginibacter sp. OK283]|jgi:hypothetical protein|uniref:hypothetical protein n=1 Tax=Mucilaginibacter sp. OK283 TaxID=1881049 RepID=UPI0008C0DFCC|nr:hypothetical protein [Mucilaginibacter sp. OK283]SEP22242.1 hypothetical protein SAMN05428947_108280 [Mucilaginibacter sp. OK283]
MRKFLLLFILLNSFNNLWAQYRSDLQGTPQFIRNLLQDDFEPKQTIVETLLHESFSPDKFIQVNNIKHQETWQYVENKTGATDSTLFETIDYQYNSAGQILQEEKCNKLNSSTYKYLYIYNSLGLIEKRTDYVKFDHKGPLKDYVSITEFAYNNSGQLTLNISYDTDSVFNYSQKREFDSQGNILKIARNSENKYLYISNIFHYNNGNLEKIDFIGAREARQLFLYHKNRYHCR